eukprot:461414_1
MNVKISSQWVSSAAGVIILLFILLYHTLTTSKDCTQNGAQSQRCTYQTWPSLLTYSFLMLIAGILYCVSALSELLCIQYILSGTLSCYVHFLLILNCYGLFKFFMYMALCRRLIESFYETTVYTYSNQFYMLWQVALVVCSLTVLIASCFYIPVMFDPSERPPCVIILSDVFVAVFIGYDAIVSGVNMWLFLRPLCKMKGNLHTSSNPRMQRRIKALIHKNAVLACVSISTAFIAWIGIYFAPGMEVMLQTIDIIVSSIAILLLFSWNGKIFHIICCCFHIQSVMEVRPTPLRQIPVDPEAL